MRVHLVPPLRAPQLRAHYTLLSKSSQNIGINPSACNNIFNKCMSVIGLLQSLIPSKGTQASFFDLLKQSAPTSQQVATAANIAEFGAFGASLFNVPFAREIEFVASKVRTAATRQQRIGRSMPHRRFRRFRRSKRFTTIGRQKRRLTSLRRERNTNLQRIEKLERAFTNLPGLEVKNHDLQNVNFNALSVSSAAPASQISLMLAGSSQQQREGNKINADSFLWSMQIEKPKTTAPADGTHDIIRLLIVVDTEMDGLDVPLTKVLGTATNVTEFYTTRIKDRFFPLVDKVYNTVHDLQNTMITDGGRIELGGLQIFYKDALAAFPASQGKNALLLFCFTKHANYTTASTGQINIFTRLNYTG